MCGICGFIGEKKGKETILRNMMGAIRHRGPDSEGIYLTEKAALGFCRLSIIDLEKGQQPMHNEEQNLALVFNGEIYNYQELRARLVAEGHRFASQADSETIVHGFERYGTGLLEQIRGMFAFAIWDDKKAQLFAARDFFGIKPFYYAIIDGCFVFASEIKSILQFPGCPRKLNEEALEQYLSFQYSVLNETFFKGIYKLPPGSYLAYERNVLNIVKYFDPLLTPEDKGSDQQTARELEKAIEDSVDRHMASDVEVGTFLSGGVDSSLIAAKFSGQRAFTVGFLSEQGTYSEIHPARILSRKLELEHHTRVITGEEYWDSVPQVMYHMDEPCGDASAVALYFLAQEASRYVKVVTSGEGADELFGGYNIYLEPEALRWTAWLPQGIRSNLGRLAEKLPAGMKGRNYLIRAGKNVEERFIGNAHIFTDQERRSLLREPTQAVSTGELLRDQYQRMQGKADLDKMQYIDLSYWLPGDILQKADKMSMAHSLELRVPFLDRDVFRIAKKLSKKERIRNYRTKYLFRRIAKTCLPEETAEKKKLGFPVPIRIWLREDRWYQEVRQKFTGEAARKFFHEEKLLALLEEHHSRKTDNSRKIWTVYAFLVWYQVFFGEGQGNN